MTDDRSSPRASRPRYLTSSSSDSGEHYLGSGWNSDRPNRKPTHDPEEVRRLKAELDAALNRPVPAKLPSQRDTWKSKARTSLLAAVSELVARGWSKRAIARHLGVDVHTFEDWLSGARQVPGWVFAGLPSDGRCAALRDLLAEDAASRPTGTDD